MRSRWLTASSGTPDHYRRLLRARLALDGRDDVGTKVSAGMFDPSVISFSHGEGMRRPPAEVIEAGVAALLDSRSSSLENYRFLERCEPLEAAITDQFVADGIPAEIASTLCIDAGTTRVFAALLHAATDPGDALFVAPTYYHPLSAWCWQAGVELICVPARAGNDYKLEAEALDASCAADARVHRRRRIVVIFNPSPTGAIYSAAELAELAHVIRRHDLLAVEDVIFAGTEFEDTPGPRPRLGACHEGTVTIGGVSKAQCLANLRLGWACGPRPLIAEMNSFTVATGASVPAIVKLMAASALHLPPAFLRENSREARERAHQIDRLTQAVRDDLSDTELDIVVEHAPHAGHSVLLAFRGPWSDSIALVRWCLAHAAVSFSPGYSFGCDGLVVKANFAMLGCDATYRAALAHEATRAALACARYLPSRTRRAVLGALTAVAPRKPAFERGRARIEEAFIQRLLPALRTLRRKPEVIPCQSAHLPTQLRS